MTNSRTAVGSLLLAVPLWSTGTGGHAVTNSRTAVGSLLLAVPLWSPGTGGHAVTNSEQFSSWISVAGSTSVDPWYWRLCSVTASLA